MYTKKAVLIILDGWGHGTEKAASAIANANTPFIDSLYTKYPNAELTTHGKAVGLPDDQMGNSEVGHLNIGAGRIVYQELQRIHVEIEEGKLQNNKTLLNLFDYCKREQKPFHLMGLVSDGGIHSHIHHVEKLIEYAAKSGVEKIYVHAFTDGRDTDPKSGIGFIKQIQQTIDKYHATLVSICGRYYAMDRDKRWERVKLAYDALVHGKGEISTNVIETMQKRYDAGETDEFLKPIILNTDATIKPNDAVLCFNFRTDRCREITEVLTQENFSALEMQTIPLEYATLTQYKDSYKNVQVLLHSDNISMTLGEVLEKYHKTQIRIAETEKYPHVTFFFSGGREQVFEGEKRIMIPSPKVATYDLQPEMSAPELTQAILPEIEKAEADFICLNFANADMVGHTGVFSAAIKAVETVDSCVEKIVTKGLEKGYSFVIIADHGNVDYMINPDGSPNTAHTKNLVPIFVLDKDVKKVSSGKLADVAPTLLEILQVPKPIEMTGNSLIDF